MSITIVINKFVVRLLVLFVALTGLLVACGTTSSTADQQTARVVDNQQGVYAQVHPLPVYTWSTEIYLADRMYQIRNAGNQSTWAVWRSASGALIDGCEAKGYGLPYGTSRTAPTKTVGNLTSANYAVSESPQAEPNGLYTNDISTSATWVFCINPVSGKVEPQYVEDNITVNTWPLTFLRDADGQLIKVGRDFGQKAIDVSKSAPSIDLSVIPKDAGQPYIVVNGNLVPYRQQNGGKPTDLSPTAVP